MAGTFTTQQFIALENYVEAVVKAHAASTSSGPHVKELGRFRFIARQRLFAVLTGKEPYVAEEHQADYQALAKKTTSKPVAPSDDNEFA